MKRGGTLSRRKPLRSSASLNGAAGRKCAVAGCDKPQRKREWCGMHHQRWVRHGDVNRVDRPGLREEVRFAKSTRLGQPSSHRPDLGPCLIYTGADNGNGYGQFAYNGKNGYAHRYAWERVHGPIPADLTVDHLCRVRCCVQVTHMELVDAVTNYRRGVASWSGTVCRSGKHPRTPENIGWRSGRMYCSACRRERERAHSAAKPKSANPNIRYDQKLVRSEIAAIRAGDQTIAAAARTIGCNPGYLGRRTWNETRRDVIARDEGRCLVCGSGGELEVHHRRGRASGGTSNPLIAFGFANLMTLCRACHHHITTNPAQAREQGWSVPSWEDPAQVPVWIAGREFVFLTTNGNYETKDGEVA